MSVSMKKRQKRSAKGPCYPKTANGSSKREKLEDSSKRKKPEDSSEGEPLDVGDHCMVLWHDDSWHPAQVLRTKFLVRKKVFEYCVRLEGSDRRMDEWVKSSRIMNSRDQKRKRDEIDHVPMVKERSYEEIDPTTAELEREHDSTTKIKYIKKVQLGNFEIDTWYFSPFPEEYQKESKIWICEYCLKYFKLQKSFMYHTSQCIWKEPPGVKVYDKNSLSIWEVDSSQHKLYCQNLCLMAKLFLDHKTIYFDVEPFLFYILWKRNKDGEKFIGYFSKEKESPECNNIACILTMPQFQKKGYGKLLISFSYELSKLEGLVASPEKPLSEFGKLSFRSYWSWTLLNILKNVNGFSNFPIKDLSAMTSITQTDIISTLQSMGIMKYWNGQHTVCVTPKIIEQLVNSEHYKRPRFILEASDINWMPKNYNPLPGPFRRHSRSQSLAG